MIPRTLDSIRTPAAAARVSTPAPQAPAPPAPANLADAVTTAPVRLGGLPQQAPLSGPAGIAAAQAAAIALAAKQLFDGLLEPIETDVYKPDGNRSTETADLRIAYADLPRKIFDGEGLAHVDPDEEWAPVAYRAHVDRRTIFAVTGMTSDEGTGITVYDRKGNMLAQGDDGYSRGSPDHVGWYWNNA